MIRPVAAAVALAALSLATPAVAQSAGVFAPLDSMRPAARGGGSRHAPRIETSIARRHRRSRAAGGRDDRVRSRSRDVGPTGIARRRRKSRCRRRCSVALDGTGLQAVVSRRRIDRRYASAPPQRRDDRTPRSRRCGAAIRRPPLDGRTPLARRNALRDDERRGRPIQLRRRARRASTRCARCAWASRRSRRSLRVGAGVADADRT